jgi:hypothetical protein
VGLFGGQAELNRTDPQTPVLDLQAGNFGRDHFG